MTQAQTSEWTLKYSTWDPDHQSLREALCALGNGYFVTRGALEMVSAGGPYYPGTYLASGYNRLESEVAGRVIENEDLVNWPNWLCLTFRIEDQGWFDIHAVDLLDFQQELDVRHGVLSMRIHFRDQQERETLLESRRIVHMQDPHLAAIQWLLTPLNWSGRVVIRSGLDGRVTNSGVHRYRALNGKHLDPLAVDLVEEDGVFLLVRTSQSHIRMAQAARTRAFAGEMIAAGKRRTQRENDRIFQELVVRCEKRKPLRVEKVVTVYTSRDPAISESGLEARKALHRAGDFEQLLQCHQRAWSRLWNRCDIRLWDNPRAQFILRLHIFHLLQTTSPNTMSRDAGVPSRGWHGEAYRGHVFWDELFIFPLLNFRLPELTRSLLMYRYRRLGEARAAARQNGYGGAMFPWQSGSDGREESQVIHLNPKSGRWVSDDTYRQRHVNAAIALNVWQYYQVSEDREFLACYGAELIIEIARFWASIAQYNPSRERYEIHNVVGPDEFHTAYPGSDKPGLNNNAYTNVMASWVLLKAVDVLDLLAPQRRRELMEELHLEPEEVARWTEISRKMLVPFHDGEIISQFEGYDQLKEFDWDGYQAKYGDIQRLDRILEMEGDTVNRYKACKQADVLMLFYLFSAGELQEMFAWMGYAFTGDMIQRNIDYYLHRTSHGSTLSGVVHAWVLARSDRVRSWGLFLRALESDISDIQGGTTSEGIHLGAMSGTVDIIQRCYAGLEIRNDVLWINPCLPSTLERIRIRIFYRGHWVNVCVEGEHLSLSLEPGWAGPIHVGVKGQVHTLHQGERRELHIPTSCPPIEHKVKREEQAVQEQREEAQKAQES